jgi:hypothetical protein
MDSGYTTVDINKADKLALMAAMMLPMYLQAYSGMSVKDRAKNAVAQAREILAEIDKREE